MEILTGEGSDRNYNEKGIYKGEEAQTGGERRHTGLSIKREGVTAVKLEKGEQGSV